MCPNRRRRRHAQNRRSGEDRLRVGLQPALLVRCGQREKDGPVAHFCVVQLAAPPIGAHLSHLFREPAIDEALARWTIGYVRTIYNGFRC